MLSSVGQTAPCTPRPRRRRSSRKLTLHNHTWYHISRYAGSFVAHNHPLRLLVRRVLRARRRAGRRPPGQRTPEFFDTRVGADSYLDPTHPPPQGPLRAPAPEVRLEAGQLVIFPSYVFHEVTPFYGRDTRITVATNCWFA